MTSRMPGRRKILPPHPSHAIQHRQTSDTDDGRDLRFSEANVEWYRYSTSQRDSSRALIALTVAPLCSPSNLYARDNLARGHVESLLQELGLACCAHRAEHYYCVTWKKDGAMK